MAEGINAKEWAKSQENIFKTDSVIEEAKVPCPPKYKGCWQDPEWKKQYNEAWQLNHVEHRKRWRKDYYEQNRDACLARGDRWYEKNKEALLAGRSKAKIERKLHEAHKTLSEYERGFLEALIDGEGCLHARIHKNGKTWLFNLIINMTNEEILNKAKQIIGEGRINHRVYRIPRRKPSWTYVASANTLRWLLPQLNLIVKREKKERILGALNLVFLTPRYSQKNEEYYRKLEEVMLS